MESAAIQDLQYRISLYQNKINELQGEIAELSRKKEALLSLEGANNRRLSDFYNAHQGLRMRLDGNCSTQSIRYAEGHKRNLEGHLSGNPQNQAASFLDEASLLLRDGIRRCGEDIIDRRRQIQSLQSEIRYLGERVKHIQQLMV